MDLDFATALELESTQNILSRYYTDPYMPLKKVKPYTHEDALKFAAASILWREGSTVTRDNRIPEVRAYYRVIAEKSGGYILEACHVNVHGLHRGDLRFIEAHDGTVKCEDVKQSQWNGTLFLGDLVTVTKLKMLKEFEIFPISKSSHHDTPCVWRASDITVLPRTIYKDVACTLTEMKTAVVMDADEVMNLTPVVNKTMKYGKVYKGTCFVPVKTKSNFTVDHNEGMENKIIKACAKIHASPNALGTVFEAQFSPKLTKLFEIGVDACKTKLHPFDPKEIMELCVLMGKSAVVSIGNGRSDDRDFPMQHVERKDNNLLEFSIDNPEENPTDGKWQIKTRIEIKGDGKRPATIESVVPQGPRKLRIVARLSRDVKKPPRFLGDLVVCQQENREIKGLNDGFMEKLPQGSNGRRILEALYGGSKITYNVPKTMEQCWYHGAQDKIMLNRYQCLYIHMLMAKPQIPMIVGSSPFGCGKSLTIVTAAQHIYERTPHGTMQLLITQSNYASVNLVDIADRLEDGSRFKFVRYLSEKNFYDLPEECLTKHDIQNLMKTVFSSWAKGEITSRMLKPRDLKRMLNYVLFRKLVEPGNLSGKALEMYNPETQLRKPKTQDLRKAFFILHKPDVIMTTADSLSSLIEAKLLNSKQVITIQIDEASQVPEHTLIRLLTQFPCANYGLIGDIQQLPPYCETGLEGKLKDYGIGNTMERAVTEKLFPQAMLREVYRCHPEVTGLLSDLFYDGKLISGITVADRSEFMVKRPDFWTRSRYPVLIVNNEERGKRMGTSCGNKSEVQIVKNLLEVLTRQHNGYQLKPNNIGVISFYAAQTSVLTESLRGKKVKCGTVDAFQGTERDVIILCCTNEKISEFMQLSNRINVAMSRAKQVTIIVGNVDGLKKAKYWGTIVREAEENGGVIDAEELQNVYLGNNRLKTSTELNNNKSKTRDNQLADEMNKLAITNEKYCVLCKTSDNAEKYFKLKDDQKICKPCCDEYIRRKSRLN